VLPITEVLLLIEVLPLTVVHPLLKLPLVETQPLEQLPPQTTLPLVQEVVTEDLIQSKLEEVQINALLAKKLYMKTNKLKPVVVYGIKDVSNVPNVAYPST